MRRPFAVLVAALTLLLPALFGAGAERVPVGSGGRATQTNGAYGWPVVPFFRQHPVRGNFGDPRIGPDWDGATQHTLHFGADVVAPNGTAVYATVSGTVSIHPLHHDAVIVSTGSGRSLEYWHVVPTMTHGWATAYETVIGHVEVPWGHVHLSERLGSTYLNPLRPGALSPYVDDVAPRIGVVQFERGGRDVGTVLHGVVDVVVAAYDPPTLPVPPPWDDIRVTPALVRWRMHTGGAHTSWRVAFDARSRLPAASFLDAYAAGTRQNLACGPGWYRFWLARGWSTWSLADGPHVIEVSAVDVRGNETIAHQTFVVGNH